MSLGLRVALLLGLWLLAWGTVSPSTVLSGLALVTVVLFAFPPERQERNLVRPRPLGVARLLLYVLGQLVVSNAQVAREVLRPRSQVHTGVLAYEVQQPSDEVIMLIANVIALTPGTMTVEATRDPPVVYVHFLLLHDVDAAYNSIARLEQVALGALGDPGRSS